MSIRNKKTNSSDIKRIVLTGSESTGKTTLAKQLADYYNTVWVPEYAREYIDNLKHPYEYEDVLYIAHRQIALEEEYYKNANHYLFLDTSLIIIKVWLLHIYKKCPNWILYKIKERKYDLYLLCDIDLPWVADNVRENPRLREYLFHLYLQEIKSFNFPNVIVTGKGNKRLLNAVELIDRFFGENRL